MSMEMKQEVARSDACGLGTGWFPREVDGCSFRKAMGLLPTGVTVVTTGYGERAEGMTANAVVSVSLDPLLLLVSIHRKARLNSRIREEGCYAVNILAADQERLSRFFASPKRSSGLPTLEALKGGYGVTGVPLVAGALAAIECELEVVYPGGDHDLFLGRVAAIRTGAARKAPLVYHEGNYLRLAESPRA